jgi:tetratricopeptide (TPR) repeat protein
MQLVRRRLAIGVLGLCVLSARPALGADLAEEETRRAKAHFTAGEAHFSLGEFDRALAEYRKAYLVRPLPPLLFNMAQCHRHLGDLNKAAFLLQRFLASSPTPMQRSQAEAVLREVERALQQRSASGPATRSVPAPRPPSSVTPAVRSALPLLPAPAAAASADSSRTPLYKKWWLWTIVVGAAVATATAIGVVATRGDELPRGTLPSVDYR